MYSPNAIQYVDEFVSSSEQIWRNLALHHLLSSGSSTVNGCRQNESKRNITIIHKWAYLHYSSPSINVWWSEMMHVCVKHIYHWGFLKGSFTQK